MVFEHIEKLQREYTDKFVVVDDQRPELRRFKNMTGFVKTVNMRGRALVQFDGHANIGWYDIDVDFLKVVEKPQEAKQSKGTVRTSAPKARKAPSALEKARGEKKQKVAAGKNLATADVLAAARAAAPAAKTQESTPKKKPAVASGDSGKSKMSTAEILAAARGQAASAKPTEAKKAEPAPPAASAPAKGDPKKMSTAEILAAARGQAPSVKPTEAKKAEPAPPAASAPAKGDPKKMSTAEILAAARGQTPSAKPAEAKKAEPAPAPSASGDARDEQGGSPPTALPTTTADIIAYCRRNPGVTSE